MGSTEPPPVLCVDFYRDLGLAISDLWKRGQFFLMSPFPIKFTLKFSNVNSSFVIHVLTYGISFRNSSTGFICGTSLSGMVFFRTTILTIIVLLRTFFLRCLLSFSLYSFVKLEQLFEPLEYLAYLI